MPNPTIRDEAKPLQAELSNEPQPVTSAEAQAFAELRQRAQESGAHVFRSRQGNGWRYHASRWGWCKAFDTPEEMLAWLGRLQRADEASEVRR